MLDDLNAALPTDASAASQGDDELRAIKEKLKQWAAVSLITGSGLLKVHGATGPANAYVVTDTTLALSGGNPLTNQHLIVSIPASNTGACTIQINNGVAGNAVAVKKNFNAPLVSGDLVTGQIVLVVFDGTNWQLISQTGNAEVLPLSRLVQVVTSSFHTAFAAVGGTYTSWAQGSAIPTWDKGKEVPLLQVSITPKFSTSSLRIKLGGIGVAASDSNNSSNFQYAVFRDPSGSSEAILAGIKAMTNQFRTNFYVEGVVPSNSTAATTFKVRISSNSSDSHVALNSSDTAGATQLYGTASKTFLTIEEYLT